MTGRFQTIILVGLLVFWQASTSPAQVVRTVALTGEDAPGAEAGEKFSALYWPAMNSAGQTAFGGVLASGDLLNDVGVWSEGSGVLNLVAREGHQAPGTAAGVSFLAFLDPLINSAGQTAFFGYLRGDGVFLTNNIGVWSEGDGSLGLVTRTGSQAPGTSAGVIFTEGLIEPRLNSAGHVAFLARLAGSGVSNANDYGIWSDRAGALAMVAREGSAAPGLAGGVSYSVLGHPKLNSSSQLSFYGRLAGPGVTAANQDAIWSDRSGPLAVVVREGSQAPGTASGVSYVDFSDHDFNTAGQVAMVSSLAGVGVTTLNDSGIWSEGSGAMSLIAREGDAAPGAGSGVKFGGFTGFDPPELNAAGQTAFKATVTGAGVNGGNNRGIWSEGFGSLHLVARAGDRPPAAPEGVRFADLGFPVLNAAGQTAFSAFLTGADVDSANNSGIWAEDRSGQLRLIARTGDMLEVRPGDFRTIDYLAFRSYTSDADGRSSGFNDDGELAFLAEFTDGSHGIFVSNAVAVPEPTSAVICGIALMAMLRNRPSRRKQ